MSRRTDKTVGIIGLGIIGQRVAEVLRRRGFHVFVWNRTPRPYPNFVGSPAEIAQLCDFVQIFVSDDEALLTMLRQLKPALKAQHVVMAHCTVAPETMRAAADLVQRRGAQFLDAPFTGSKLAAEKGELVYYIGGDDGAFQRARPVLQASSKEIIEIGEIGQATTIKLATNMFTAATVQVAAEALALIDSANIPAEKLARAMSGNASSSATLSMKLPKMIARDFEPHFSVKNMLKDVEIISRLARAEGVVFGATDAARDSLRREVEQGRAGNDYSSVFYAFFPETPEPAVEPDEMEPELEAIAEAEEPRAEEDPELEPAEAEGETAKLVEDQTEAGTEAEASETEEQKEHAAAVEPIEAADSPESESEPVEAEPTPAAPEPVVAEAMTEEAKEGENGDRRGFLSRLFSKGLDY
ncbi:MAG: NAD(P)-dependent oxidoreductase [Verrucomicrobiota bacterium]|nr:NAD(P)-dependent oxidoreductase [Verrucomicrobiota bacterium]